jgi:hypothetical protein
MKCGELHPVFCLTSLRNPRFVIPAPEPGSSIEYKNWIPDRDDLSGMTIYSTVILNPAALGTVKNLKVIRRATIYINKIKEQRRRLQGSRPYCCSFGGVL